MTAQEMVQLFIPATADRKEAEISGEPYSVPHGGIAVGIRICRRRSFNFECYQFYGTQETLSCAVEILQDHNVDFDPAGEYIAALCRDMPGKRLNELLTAKVFPYEDLCVARLARIKKMNPKLDVYASHVFMNSEARFTFGRYGVR